MSENISKDYKLLVISDTGMYEENGHWYAFGPVVTELNHLLSIFFEITWIGFNRNDQKRNSSYKVVNSDRINIIPLNRVGGTDLMSKIKILLNYPNMWFNINDEVKKHDYIHVRAPSNPAIISMQLSKRYMLKKFWFKYAGSWVNRTSVSYNWQRNELKKLKDNSIVTINGHWENQPKNVLAFENPCLSVEDRKIGKKIIEHKRLDNVYNICFVGGLNENKGIKELISALELIDHNLYGEINIVGDGNLKEELMSSTNNLKIKFHGHLSKNDVISVYQKCDFIVLPSKSEGFPKVISEGMNYGCIPIVSKVSSIPQVIGKKNGFLIKSHEITEIAKSMSKALTLNKSKYINMIRHNYELSGRFTYDIYVQRVLREVFNIRLNG